MSIASIPSHGHRQFVAVDIENLLGCNPRDATPRMYRAAFDQLTHVINVQPHDHLALGVDVGHAILASTLRPGSRVVPGVGPGGADLALIDVLDDVPFLVGRYSNIVIASGDHAFVGSVKALRQAGAHVTVAAIPAQLSAALNQAASAFLPLLPPEFKWAA